MRVSGEDPRLRDSITSRVGGKLSIFNNKCDGLDKISTFAEIYLDDRRKKNSKEKRAD